MSRMPAWLAAVGIAVLGIASTAAAAPTVTLKTTALPIAGYPGTGDILGAGAVIQVQYTFSGTEYGGFAPPLTGVRYFIPAGARLHPQGFATCLPSTVERSGPAACPKQSFAGPLGSARGVVSFGGERVHETLSIQPLFAPAGDLEFYVEGKTPVSVEILATGHIRKAPPPFGLEAIGEVPLIETVPGALDGSTEVINLKVGAAYKRGKKTVSYITIPRHCPRGGWLVKSELIFLGGTTVETSYKMPCPKR